MSARRGTTPDGRVHLVNEALAAGAFTLCGFAHDAADSESDEGLRWIATSKRTVTCESCAAVVRLCRGVPIAPAGTNCI